MGPPVHRPRRAGTILAALLLVLGSGCARSTGPSPDGSESAATSPSAPMTPEEARADTPSIYDGDCYAKYELTTPAPAEECQLGVLGGPRVVLLGDSHAAQWFDALEHAAREEGWQLQPLVKAACPPGELLVHNAGMDREYTECTTWNAAAAERIAADPPDAVVVATRADYYRVVRDGGRLTVEESAPLLGEELADALRTFAAAGADTYLIRDTPVPGFNVPDCLDGSSAADCGYPLAGSLPDDAAQLQAAEQAGSTLIDLNRQVCGAGSECSTVSDGLITFRDDDHLAATFAATLSDVLGQAIEVARAS